MTDGERKDLVRRHMKLALALAGRRFTRKVARVMEFGDVLGFASVGLMEAAARYKPQEGAAFATYAYLRIDGAISDGVRKMGFLHRGDVARFKATGETVHLDSFGEMLERRLADTRALPGEALELEQDISFLLATMAELPVRERRVLELCYLEGKTLEAAGEILGGKTKSWMCRLRELAVQALRDRVAEASREAV